MNALVNLIYTSIESEHFDKTTIGRLLVQARLHNSSHSITGLLIYHGGVFIQWIEGLESDVQALWSRIQKDVRHQSIVQIEYGPISQRFFPDWSMGHLEADSTGDPFMLSLSERDQNELALVNVQPWLAVDILFRQAAHVRAVTGHRQPVPVRTVV